MKASLHLLGASAHFASAASARKKAASTCSRVTWRCPFSMARATHRAAEGLELLLRRLQPAHKPGVVGEELDEGTTGADGTSSSGCINISGKAGAFLPPPLTGKMPVLRYGPKNVNAPRRPANLTPRRDVL